jgi:hypothetical protein
LQLIAADSLTGDVLGPNLKRAVAQVVGRNYFIAHGDAQGHEKQRIYNPAFAGRHDKISGN